MEGAGVRTWKAVRGGKSPRLGGGGWREGQVELREQGEGKKGEGRGVNETDEAIWFKELVRICL